MITRCLADLGADPARTVYVGDAESDLAAATAAGVGFVAVGDMVWAPRRIGHLRELPAFLAGYEP